MLKALYDYTQRANLNLPVGYDYKPIKAFLCLTGDGTVVGVQTTEEGNSFLCPDIGSDANAKDKSNLLAEKRSVVLPKEPSAKSQFFRKGLRDLGEQEPLAMVCLKALEDPQRCAQMDAELDRHKVKPEDRISFLVQDTYLVECPTVEAWWMDYRQTIETSSKSKKPAKPSLCLITGAPTIPSKTVPKTQGLQPVGGHPSGDALICFDKKSFWSYGLEQGANAPVSEKAFTKVKAALNHLLRGAPRLAGAKFVHWYDQPLPEQAEDPLLLAFGSMSNEEEEAEEDSELDPETEADVMRQARRDADALVQSVQSGQPPVNLPNRYYILLLSGVNGRVMVRQFTQGAYEELKANLDRWYDELRLINMSGTAEEKPKKLTGRLLRLLKHHSNDKNPSKQMDKRTKHHSNDKNPSKQMDSQMDTRIKDELPALSLSIVHSIIHGTPLPDVIAARALQYIRSDLYAQTRNDDSRGMLNTTRQTSDLYAQTRNDDSEKKNKRIAPDPIACQWLKVWLIRTQKEANLMPEYNPQHPSPAYHIGAMVAVYAALQQSAYPDVNVTVVERFFASAQQTPALVLGRLAKMSTHHLAKLENPAVERAYTNRLSEVAGHIGDSIPTVLGLADQSLFALGYYQMTAAMNKERQERIAAAKEHKEV